MSQANRSPYYKPADAALIPSPWNITLLAQRDTHLQVPINFVTQPGVVIRAACFAHNRYEYNAFVQCLSNLLAGGFRRFTLDVYWDQRRRAWSLCPAEIPVQDASPESLTQSITSPLTSSRHTLSGSLPGGASMPLTSIAVSTTSATAQQKRQVLETLQNPTASSSSVTVTVLPASATLASLSSVATSTPPPNGTSYTTGPYSCNPRVDFDLFTSILQSYYTATDDTLRAEINYVSFRVHVASSLSDPTSPAIALDPNRTPLSPRMLGALAYNKLATWLYTSDDLVQQRQSLRTSWLLTDNSSIPDTSYFNLTNGGTSTANGWPSESWLEFENGWRLLLELSSVDALIAPAYDFELDGRYLFPAGYLSQTDPVEYTSDQQQIARGCHYNASTTLLAHANSSFAVSTGLPSSALIDPALVNANLSHPAVSNMTACGISPILNATLFNRTADQDPGLYMAFALSAVWSWAPGEPLGEYAIDSAIDNSSGDSDFRCAVLSLNSNGRWHASFCATTLRGACRANSTPYLWRLTNKRAHYVDLEDACPPGTLFAVPRTALENRYLLAAVRAASEDEVFVNLNSKAVQYCWVEGVHNTCPYVSSNNDKAQIVVPTVAAVLVFVIALGLVLVKCGGNRREKRTGRRKGEVSWDYEGVPS